MLTSQHAPDDCSGLGDVIRQVVGTAAYDGDWLELVAINAELLHDVQLGRDLAAVRDLTRTDKRYRYSA